MDILDLQFISQDIGKTTVREHMKHLLVRLWLDDFISPKEDEYGLSAWQYDLYYILIKNGHVDGEIDKNTGLLDFDIDEMGSAMREIINLL